VGSSTWQSLQRLAHKVEMLMPSHLDPEGIHERMAEIASDLRLIAAGCCRGRRYG